MREAGILLPISALNSKYGIGSFSKEAYAFVDWLKGAGQSYWQILPLGPTSFGDSPYQSFSSFAGNPYFIDLIALVEEGLIKEEGRSELPGRPILYATTNEFLDYFGLASINDLPDISIKEMPDKEVELYKSKYTETIS